MGNLTTDMTHLCGEINVLRGARETFLKNLRYVVNGMQTGFRLAHADMARKTKAERSAFASRLKKKVSGMRKEFTSDIAGAHRAWFGKEA